MFHDVFGNDNKAEVVDVEAIKTFYANVAAKRDSFALWAAGLDAQASERVEAEVCPCGKSDCPRQEQEPEPQDGQSGNDEAMVAR